MESLQLYQKLILCGHNLYFWSYDANWDLISSNCPDKELLDLFFRINLPALPEDTSRPLVISNSLGLLWIADFQKKEQSIGQIHVIGPVFTEDVSLQNLEANLGRLHLPSGIRKEFLAILNQIPILTITRLFEYGLMLHYCLTEEYLTSSDLQYPVTEKLSPKEMESHKDTHVSWAMEQELLKLVEEGNPDYKQRAARLVNMVNLANLGNGDTLRHFKNTTIIFTALCTRAAIRGGLQPEIAYSLSDMYIRGIEASRNLGEITEVNSTMQEDFVHRVHQCRSHPELSPQTQKCCHYIQTHLNEKITMEALSTYVGYSETYLSKKFRKEKGITVTEYIVQQKIDMAKQMLRANEMPISDIAEYLCFSTQSYFCEQFRKATGQTPGEYRQNSMK